MNLTGMKKLIFAGVELKQLAIDGVQAWKSGYTNLVPTAIDTDGSIFRENGYVDGYRNSSSGALKAQANTVTTGFIRASLKDVVRMAGTKWDATTGYNYFAMYDANFNLLDTINRDTGGNGNAASQGWSYTSKGWLTANATHVYVENGITRFAIAAPAGREYAYIRISAFGMGADMIVTVNEEIP